MKTRAAVLYRLNSPLEIEELEIPKLQRGQVLVKVQASGICRTQLNEIKGVKGPDKYLPHLLGHEGAGIVIETGEGVMKVTKGDNVVLSWIKGKGLDVPSSKYSLNGKIINSGAITTFSEYAVISENRINKISKDIPPDCASLLGCAVATGGGIILHDFKVSRQSSLAVFGVGGVGSGAILVAKMKDCGRIIAVDVSREKLNFAKELGATDTFYFNAAKTLKVDYALEASGVKEVMERAFESIKNTGTVVIAGNLAHGEKISINPFDLILGKKIIGSWGGKCQPDEDIPYYVKACLSRDLKLDKLITHKFKLEEINKALELMRKNQVLGRMIIEL